MGEVCGTASGRGDAPGPPPPPGKPAATPPPWPATTTDKRMAGAPGKAGAPDTVGIAGGGKQMLLKKRPVGDFKDDDFEMVETPEPEPGPGEIVVKNVLISIDPTHRIWATDADQYMAPVGLNTVMRAGTIGKVVKSSDPEKMAVGTYVGCIGGVQEYAKQPIAACWPTVPDVPLSNNHSLFSMVIGLTAWVGTNICEPQKGKTMVISGAAGAVGSIAGQIAKSRGAKVIGIAGSADKCTWLKELGFDETINYKTEKIDERLDSICPDGVDSYFDNVGGETLEILLKRMKNFGNIAFCGSISGYNSNEGDSTSMTVKNYEMILMRRIKIQGFICSDHAADMLSAMGELGTLVKAGKLQVREDIQEVGIEDYPKVVRMLYSGKNTGKLMMKLAE